MKNTIAAFALTTIMAVSAFANGGIIVSDFNDNTPKDPCKETVKVDSGIIVSDIVGILISDFTGILISDFKGSSTVNCGIIVSDATGILISD